MAALAPLGSDAVPHASRDQQKTASTKDSSSYEVANPVFSSIIDPTQPGRVVAERDYAFAHEAPVYLEKLNKVSSRKIAGGLLLGSGRTLAGTCTQRLQQLRSHVDTTLAIVQLLNCALLQHHDVVCCAMQLMSVLGQSL
jgi:hypothetical protein